MKKLNINVQHYFINRTCGKIPNLGIFNSTNISSPAVSHVCFSHFVQSLGLNHGLGPGLCPHLHFVFVVWTRRTPGKRFCSVNTAIVQHSTEVTVHNTVQQSTVQLRVHRSKLQAKSYELRLSEELKSRV